MYDFVQATSGPPSHSVAARCLSATVCHICRPQAENGALATLRPLRGIRALGACGYFLSRGHHCMCACECTTLRPFQNGHRRGRSAWHGQGCCLVIDSTVRASSQHRRAACDDAARMHTVHVQGFECRQNNWVMFSRPRNVSRLGCELRSLSAGQSRCAPAMIWPLPPPDDSPRPHAVA
jgi:hypothetical protein